MAAQTKPNPWRGIAAGIVAGLAASAVMSAYQAIAAKPFGQDEQTGEPATVELANDVGKTIVGAPVPKPQRPLAGEAVHYLTGAAIGAAYGLMAEYQPRASAGFGTAYGIATSLVLDDVVVPALGLGDAPWKTPPETHAYAASSHIVFGFALEAARRLLGGRA